ncbi:MAG: ABC transporter permease [Anaerolineae bacterium]|nr:ABC transporter permease [Anaerolineae bacterium]
MSNEPSIAAPRPPLFANTWAIFKRELYQYFVSPIAYFVAFVMLLIAGLLFGTYLRIWVNNQLPADSTAVISYVAFLTVFMAPLLTMRLLAEENREGTIELLLTLPIRDVDIVLGKFLGAWAFYTVVIAVTLVYEFILTSVGQPDQGAAIAGYLGIWLYGGAALAIGLMFSAITENQIVAGFLSLAMLVILFLIDAFSMSVQSAGAQTMLRELSLSSHYYRSFSQGIIRVQDLLFYIFIIAGALFITTQLVGSRRWR